MNESEDRPRVADRKAIAVVLFSVLVDMMGIGIVVPILPDMIRSIAHTDISQASVVGGWLFEKFGYQGVNGFNIYSMIVAIIGAILVLFIYHAVTSRRATY